jgi:prepilin-type N-terminal cleavage/methylation domain-containing protein
MLRTAMKRYNNKKGFTLIELMVAMAILFISMTAILDFIVQYHRINLENTMRNEAMRIAESRIENLRNTAFGLLTTGAEPAPGVQRIIRNLTVNYQVAWTVSPLSANSTAVQVNVIWSFKGINHRHDASTIISTEV